MTGMFRHWKIYISVICFVLFIQISPIRAMAVDQNAALIQDQTGALNDQQDQGALTVQPDQNTQNVLPDTTTVTQTVRAAHQVEYTGDRELYAKTNNNNVRTSPDVGAEILISAPPGHDLKIWSIWESSTGEKWYEVEYLGNRGYVWGGAVNIYENETAAANDTDDGDTDETEDGDADSETENANSGFVPSSDIITALPSVAPITVERYDDSQGADDTVLFLFLIILGGGCVFLVFKRLQYEVKRYRSIINKSAMPVTSPKRRKPNPPVDGKKKSKKKENYDFIDMLDDD